MIASRRAAARRSRSRMIETSKSSLPTSVLFVCLGNICRSPTAEGVFRARAAQAGLDKQIVVASAGIGDWHVGEPPDRRAITHAAKRGYDIRRQRARQVCEADFDRFDWILAMDSEVLRGLAQMRPTNSESHVGLFLDFAPTLGVRDVPDPYFGAPDGFERVLDLVEAGSDSLLAALRSGRR